MKLVTFRVSQSSPRVGVVQNDRVYDVTDFVGGLEPMESGTRQARWFEQIPQAGMLKLLGCGSSGLESLRSLLKSGPKSLKHYALQEVDLQAPVMRPGKIIGVGKNYADHAAEVGSVTLTAPKLFSKFPSVVVGPGAQVHAKPIIRKMDYEAELAVVIGSFASQVKAEHALDVIAGYTILNDVSAREFQHDVPQAQTSFAKSMDGFCPMGPWLVTADEIPDPQALDVSLELNGTQMQHGNTAQMIFTVRTLIEYITQYVELEPGDVIATGTPAGVGSARKPPVWLKAGDQVRISVSGIGTLDHGVC